MSQANVQSLESLVQFRAVLIEFCDQIAKAVGSAEMECGRFRQWLEFEQPAWWRQQLELRREEISIARNDLARKRLGRMSGYHPDLAEEKDELRLAQKRVEEAEEKLELVRKWSQRVGKSIDQALGKAYQLNDLVAQNPPPAVAALDEIIASVDRYLAGVPIPTPPSSG